MKILVFGDSIAWGAWDPEGGWVSRLRKSIDKKNLSDPDYYCKVYNLGVSGDTTRDLLERFVPETIARVREEEDDILVLAIGTNDSSILLEKEAPLVPPEEFEKNLVKLVCLARRYYSHIVLLGLPSVIEEKTNPIPWNPSRAYHNENIEHYEAIIGRVATRENALFVPLFERFLEAGPRLLSGDGLHPGPVGHQEIFESIRKILETLGV